MNISTFEEEEDNIENVGTTDSFKTLSNDASPRLKLSEKEFDTWSTADAPSIDEEYAEQDNVLSKIDELLAEDFNLDTYQAETPLKDDELREDLENYLQKGISTPEEQKKDFTQSDSSSLPKDTLLQIDKGCTVTDSETISSELTEKDSTGMLQAGKELKVSEYETVCSKVTAKKDSTQSFKSESSLSKEIPVSQSESLTNKTKTSTKASETPTVTSDEIKPFEVETEKIPSPSDEVVQPIAVKDKQISSVDTKTSDKLESSKDVLSTSKEASAPVALSFSDFGKQSNDTSIDNISVLDTAQFVTVKDKQIPNVEAESHIKSPKDVLSTSKDVSASVAVSSSNSEKQSKDIFVDNTKSVSDSTQFIDLKDKQISSVNTEACIKLESHFKSPNDVISTAKDEFTSAALSFTDSGKQSKDPSATVSISDTIQFSKSKETSSVETEASFKLESNVKSSKDVISTSKDASASVAMPSTDSGKQLKDISATLSVSDTIQSSKSKKTASVEAETFVKLENRDKISKSVLSTSEDASTSVTPSSRDSDKQIKDIVTDSDTLSILKAHSSSDIPSKKLAKSAEASEEISLESKTSTEPPEGTEFVQTSDLLKKSAKDSVVTAASTVKVQSNIPDQQVYKDETRVKSASEKPATTTEEQTAGASTVVEVKPDIPKKTRQRSIDSKEGTPSKEEKPSLPPKLSKRHSVSNSPSSSLGESLSSSSSVESLGSFESAASGRSRKSSLKSSDEPSMHSVSPEIPARRSRSSKVSSSSRSTSRDSDNSAPSRSSSLKIRRRSSNFREPEPIDLSKKRASIDERMQKLQNEGKCTTKEKAFIAAKLIEMQFEEEDALLASRQCNSVYHAVKFLTQLCEMCNCRFPINLMSSMMQCTHRACRECLKAHFTSLIYDRSIFTLLCPICQKPDITDQNIQEYFNDLDMMLRNFLEDRVYDLFQRKLRDEVLTKDPNFHWCSQCSSGFIASPRLKKLYCPDCSAITCALCHQTWELEHEGVHCERFQQWKDMHTPEPPPAGLVKFLIDRGISCPSCGIVYAQACGGSMMYKCSHCSYEFCGFCIRPCKRGKDCSNKTCESRGLHIHHLQNCLFYLRDKDITEIQMLLEEESVTYLTIPPKDQIVKSRCQVREQKNVHGVLTEDRCGRGIEPYCGGLCSTHYYEYLAELLRMNNISPLSIMTIQDLQFMLRKSRILVPEKMKGEASEEYYERLLNLVSSALT